jgi:putative ubiquitin-RnfH superfamily antitoxin RatB of RatAB toxin-antitoxin module
MEEKPLQTSSVSGTELNICVAWSLAARQFMEMQLKLHAGATVADALALLDAGARESAGLNRAHAVGIWGKKAAMSRLLQDRDRVEIYRPLVVDPKTARRERFNQQGAAKAGLFANKRAGAKAGY